MAAGLLVAADKAPAPPAGMSRAEIEAIVHEYIVTHPEVVLEAIRALEKKDRAAREKAATDAIRQEARALKQDPDAFVAGNAKGDVTLVEFFDYNCGYCRTVAGSIQSLIADDKKLRVVLKEWPVRGPDSEAVARVSLAAAKQPQFLAFHFALLADEGHVDEARALAVAAKMGLDMKKLQADMKSVDTTALIAKNDRLAEKIGIRGTPAFIIGDTLVPGAAPLDELKTLIAETRKSCKSASC